MAVPAILHDLIEAGVEFQTDGDRIRWRNAGGRVTPEVIDALRTHKAEAIRFLRGEPNLSGKHDKTPDQPAPDEYPHGLSYCGRPLTWTGCVVPMTGWRNLTDWERDGPNGRLWNGLTQQWEFAGT